LRKGGKVFVNGEDETLPDFTPKSRRYQYFCPTDASEIKVSQRGTTFTLDGQKFKLKFPGVHFIANAVGAVRLVQAMGLPLKKASTTLENTPSLEHRLRIVKIRSGASVIDDCYNANPAAVLSAVDVMERCFPKKNKILVLGEMLEMGKMSRSLHVKLGENLKKADITDIRLVGNIFTDTQQAYKSPGRTVKKYKSVSALIRSLRSKITRNDVILVKGSRAIGLEKVVDALVNQVG